MGGIRAVRATGAIGVAARDPARGRQTAPRNRTPLTQSGGPHGGFLPAGSTDSCVVFNQGTARPGVDQALSSRAGGEVISSDGF